MKGFRIFFDKLLKKLFLKAIPVFVFHQVCDEYDPLTTWECDWTQTDRFKNNIRRLKKKYRFISLQEAHEKIKHDVIRLHDYAVLTADDGYLSLLNVIPWLEEHKIPITLFINSRYLDKQSWSDINEEQARRYNQNVNMLNNVCPNLYLSKEELFSLTSPLVSVGMHGHEHLDAVKLTEEEFLGNFENCLNILSNHPGYIPYYAYTWGKHNSFTDMVLYDNNIIPVFVNGGVNSNNASYIDRICIDGKTF